MTKLTLLLTILSCTHLIAQEVQTVRIISLENKPIIRALINGKKANLLIDTGSDISVLHQGYSSKYGYRIFENNQNHAAIGIKSTTKVLSAAGATVTVGDAKLYSNYFGLNLEGIIHSIQNKTSIKIAGIIGSDILINYNFVIDYKKKIITFYYKKNRHIAKSK